MNRYVSAGLTFVISFLISGGGAYLNATGNGTPVTTSLIVGAVVTGVVAAAQAVQKQMEAPPT